MHNILFSSINKMCCTLEESFSEDLLLQLQKYPSLFPLMQTKITHRVRTSQYHRAHILGFFSAHFKWRNITLHCEENHTERSLTFDQRCPASFESRFEVVSLKVAAVTKIMLVVGGFQTSIMHIHVRRVRHVKN